MQSMAIPKTNVVALPFAAAFRLRQHPLQFLVRDRRRAVSFGNAIAVPCRFVQVGPEPTGVCRAGAACVWLPG